MKMFLQNLNLRLKEILKNRRPSEALAQKQLERVLWWTFGAMCRA